VLESGRRNAEANLASPDAAQTAFAIAETKRTIDFAARARLPKIVVHLGGVGNYMSEQERALRRLGVDARTGEIPREYCPGEYSINAGGRTKLVGIGQRLIRGTWHIGGVIVVAEAERVRDILVPVYEALGLDWDPATAGSVADEVPGATWEDVADALRAELPPHEPAGLDAATLALAERLEREHRAPG